MNLPTCREIIVLLTQICRAWPGSTRAWYAMGMIAAIVARAKNRVIGKNGDLPWLLPDDLAYFRRVTRGGTVIMGRKTYDSIAARLGHALPDRHNIVLTSDVTLDADDITVARTVDEAVHHAAAGADVFVIGGAQVYEAMLPKCDKLFITEVDATVDGDAYFPELDMQQWRETSREHHVKDDRHPYDFDFVVYSRER